jgi:hypothetical protein
MNILLVLAAMVAYSIGEDSVCRKFDCSPNLTTDPPMEGRLCGLYQSNITSFLVQACGSTDFMCPLSLDSVTDVTCYNHTFYPNPMFEHLFPGDNCENVSQCISGLRCENGICVGAAENATCGLSNDCNVGLYCTYGSCVPVKQFGEACDRLNQELCAFGTDCFRGTCTKYGTVDNELSLQGSNSHYLCNSFYAASGANRTSFCVNPPALISDEFERSDPNDIMCNYTAYEAGTGERIDGVLEPAQCGFNIRDSHW